MMINSLSETSVKLIEAILDFYDSLLSSCCVLTQSCLTMSVMPSLNSLVSISKSSCHHRHIQAQSLLRQTQGKIIKKEWVYDLLIFNSYVASFLINFIGNINLVISYNQEFLQLIVHLVYSSLVFEL